MHDHGRIAQHGLRAGRRDLDEIILTLDRIIDVPEFSGSILMFHFRVADRGLAFRAPVDDLGPFIDPAFLIHLNEYFQNGIGYTFIHRKALSVPVCAAAQFFQLIHDTSAVFFLPFPGFLKEPFSSKVFLVDAFFFQCFYDFDFGCNAGVVTSRLPKRVIPLHPFLADHDILQRIVQGMAHMQLAGDVRRRHDDRERLFALIHFRMEIFLFHPSVIDWLFDFFRIISLS